MSDYILSLALPDATVRLVEDFADAAGMTPAAVIDVAIHFFLNECAASVLDADDRARLAEWRRERETA